MVREIWVYLESDENGFHESAHRMVHEARRTAEIVGGSPCGFLLENGIEWSENAPKLEGLEKLYVIQEAKGFSIETRAGVIRNVVQKKMPHMVLFAGTFTGNELGGRVAAALDRGYISDCTDFEMDDGLVFARKSIYGGKADVLLKWETAFPLFASIHLNSLENISVSSAQPPEVVLLKKDMEAPRAKLRNRWRVPPSELDLNEAAIVIGVGKGVPFSSMSEIYRLSEVLEAAVGGTRIAVHAGLIPVERQIGTTGKWLNSDLYIALGISGAPQHMMGIKDVRKIIAVNMWKGASIFQKADLGVVGDLREILPELLVLLEKGKR